MDTKTRLSPTQSKIVRHGDGPLLVVAGPGSGKTRVLTERIRRLLSEAGGNYRILALTFTNKAANEMRDRLAELPEVSEKSFIGTLHSFCAEMLADRGKHVGVQGLPNIFESYQDRKQVLADAVMGDPELRSKLAQAGDPKDRGKVLDRWLEMISGYKSRLLLPEILEDDLARRIYQAYDKGLRASSAVDFDDLLLLGYRLLTERPAIAGFYRRLYRYICIDEAQDLNEAQYQVLRALCGDEQRNVMLVGDPRQAIFVWNGANPKYLDMFERDFHAKKIAMNDNFRSSRTVVEMAQLLDPEYEVEGRLPVKGSVRLIVGADEREEASRVLDYLVRLVKEGHKDIEGDLTWERCALLGRTRYVLSAAEKELSRRGIRYYKQLSAGHESESDFVRDFELCLKIVANPHDRLHLGILVRNWGLEAKTNDLADVGQASDMLGMLDEIASNPGHGAVVKAAEHLWTDGETCDFMRALLELEAYAAGVDSMEERALILQDIQVWRSHWDFFLRSQSGGRHKLSAFLGQVALGTTQQPRREGLALLTVHSAKGLEFDAVAILGMAEGTFPDYRAKSPALLEEETRNAFVAVTRSRRLVALSYPQTKQMPWGDVWEQRPSRYLHKMGLI